MVALLLHLKVNPVIAIIVGFTVDGLIGYTIAMSLKGIL